MRLLLTSMDGMYIIYIHEVLVAMVMSVPSGQRNKPRACSDLLGGGGGGSSPPTGSGLGSNITLGGSWYIRDLLCSDLGILGLIGRGISSRSGLGLFPSLIGLQR